MAQTLVNIRMDEELKSNMEEICKELGITMSAAFNMFARKMIREKRIHQKKQWIIQRLNI